MAFEPEPGGGLASRQLHVRGSIIGPMPKLVSDKTQAAYTANPRVFAVVLAVILVVIVLGLIFGHAVVPVNVGQTGN